MFKAKILILRRLVRKVRVRVLLFASPVVVAQAFSPYVSSYFTETDATRIAADALEQILNLLASSMLAVTTFSLSIAVAAFSGAAGSATPRATALLQDDPTTKNVLATFLGAFLFSLLGLIGLKVQLFDHSGQLTLFAFTLVVIVMVMLALIRWIDHLMVFGRMENTLDRVENAATQSLNARLSNPYLGALQLKTPPSDAKPVLSEKTGYVQHINMKLLERNAERMNARIHLLGVPGKFVSRREPLVLIQDATPDETDITSVRNCFFYGESRTFEEDPRFGVLVLSEIASRALSPAVNDPGTAIQVLGRIERVLSNWREEADPELIYPHVHVPAVTPHEMLREAFRPIARDGAGIIEVQIRIQKSLAALTEAAPDVFLPSAAELSQYALNLAEKAGLPASELDDLRDKAPKRGDRVSDRAFSHI